MELIIVSRTRSKQTKVLNVRCLFRNLLQTLSKYLGNRCLNISG